MTYYIYHNNALCVLIIITIRDRAANNGCYTVWAGKFQPKVTHAFISIKTETVKETPLMV